MHILVSGASGLVGTRLRAVLEQAGHAVTTLVRRESGPDGKTISWDPEKGNIDVDNLSRFDAVFHLAGEPIAGGRWTEARKARIRDSRVNSTSLLAQQIAKQEANPPVFISASALGYYGNRGEEVVTEETGAGTGFLAEVCQAWEAATTPARDAGARVVNIRIGLVLAAEGGALAKMLPPFRMGLGGPLGDGAMWMSWIHVDDLVRAMLHALHTEALNGPVNGFGPNPVQNKEFTRTLARILKRPAVLPAPAFALRLALGEMADELLLSSLRGQPERLLDSGFTFKFPHLEDALADLL